MLSQSEFNTIMLFGSVTERSQTDLNLNVNVTDDYSNPPLLSSGQVIEFDDGSGSVLRIQPLRTHRDEAIYECTATNSVGEINTSAKLTVLEGKTCLSSSLSNRSSTHACLTSLTPGEDFMSM